MGEYCGKDMYSFYTSYRQAHGYVSITVCIFGSIANILNIIVLTRPEMHSPTNFILTGLAVADLIVMLICIPNYFHVYIFTTPHKDSYTFSWAWVVLLHNNLAQAFHTISIWLTVALAVWRCIAVAYPQKNRDWCGKNRTIITIIAGYIICPILCIPIYISYTIKPKIMGLNEAGNMIANNTTEIAYQNMTLYFVTFSEVGQVYISVKVTFWIYSVVIKLIPCLLLTLLSMRLISALMETKKRREALVAASSTRKSSRNVEKERQTDRATRMLLAVLVLFLLTELPQGILGLLSVLLGEEFFTTCYMYLGDVMDFLALFNSAINFMIYCIMSRQFRFTFSKLFRPSWLPLPQGDMENGVNNQNMTTTVVTQV